MTTDRAAEYRHSICCYLDEAERVLPRPESVLIYVLGCVQMQVHYPSAAAAAAAYAAAAAPAAYAAAAALAAYDAADVLAAYAAAAYATAAVAAAADAWCCCS